MKRSTLTKLTTVFAAIAIAYTPVTLVTPVQAYDDDVEYVCGEDDDGKDYCVSVAELTAECPDVDPEYTTELCQGLLEDKRPGRGVKHLAMIGLFQSYDNAEDPGRDSASRR